MIPNEFGRMTQMNFDVLFDEKCQYGKPVIMIVSFLKIIDIE
jgi:hypothetical protein